MKIILLKTYEGLGKIGEIVNHMISNTIMPGMNSGFDILIIHGFSSYDDAVYKLLKSVLAGLPENTYHSLEIVT